MEYPIQPGHRRTDAETQSLQHERLHLSDIIRRPFVLFIFLVLLSGLACSIARLSKTANFVELFHETFPVLCGGTASIVDNQISDPSVRFVLRSVSDVLAMRLIEGDPLASCTATILSSQISDKWNVAISAYLLLVSTMDIVAMLGVRPLCWNSVLTRRCSKNTFDYFVLGSLFFTILEIVAVFMAHKSGVIQILALSIMILTCNCTLLILDVYILTSRGNSYGQGRDSVEIITREVREVLEVYGGHRHGGDAVARPPAATLRQNRMYNPNTD